MRKPRTFHLQEHHIKLARRMCVGWQDCETGAPEINPKRPYGNSGVAQDVAEIIGEEWPDGDALSADDYDRQREEIADRMLALHSEMETALQIILGNAGAATVPGFYRDVSGPFVHPQWVLADDKAREE
jgi:hypothetical protein